MKKNSCLGLLLALTLLLLSACAGAPGETTAPAATSAGAESTAEVETSAPEKHYAEKDIVILYTNDTHCGVSDGFGFAGVAALKRRLETSDCYTLLVDVGDAVQGDLIGSLSSGADPLELMNAVGYDLAAPGNHEFDYKIGRFTELQQLADFPYLCCNLTDKRTGETVCEPWRILERGGVRLGFVGVLTPRTIVESTPTRFEDENGVVQYDFCRDDSGEALYRCVQENVDAVRAAGADYVVVLGHLGDEASASPWTSKELIAHTSGIDVLLDGHSHSVTESERVKAADGKWVLVSQTGTRLEHVGLLRIAQDGTLSAELLSDDGARDGGVTALIESKTAGFEEQMKTVVATTEQDLVIYEPGTDPAVRIVRRAETNVGNLVADALRLSYGADVGIMNGGGLQAELPKGEITLGQLCALMPHGNKVVVAECTGQQLLDCLELGVSALPEEGSGFHQVSGLSFTIDMSVPSGVQRDADNMFAGVEGAYRVKDLRIGGEPVELEKTYTVASTDYILVKRGSGRSMFDGCRILLETGKTDFEVVKDYIVNELNGTVGAEYADPHGEGRIVAAE